MMLWLVTVCLVLGADAIPFPNNPSQGGPDVSPRATQATQAPEKDQQLPTQAASHGKDSPNLITITAGHIKVKLDQDTIDTLTELFNHMDTDKDGFISMGEHKAMWDSVDTDGDDVLSTEEISNGHMTWYEVFAGDINGDGIMSRKDSEHFSKGMDLNGDGRNGLDEFLVFIGLVKTQNEASHNYT